MKTQQQIEKMIEDIELKLQWCKTQKRCAQQDCDMQLFNDLYIECEKLSAQYNILIEVLK